MHAHEHCEATMDLAFVRMDVQAQQKVVDHYRQQFEEKQEWYAVRHAACKALQKAVDRKPKAASKTRH